ncbi:MAG: hypothetical protein ABIH35_01925 [Patescibacteria group bacterium]
MQKLSKQVLAKIKSEKISPKEKWTFLVRNYGIWVLAVLALILAGVFVGNAIHDLSFGEWGIMHRFPGGRWHFLRHALPLLWLVGITAAFIFAFALLRKTKRGYRYGTLVIAGVTLLTSVIGGLALLRTPLPRQILDFRMEHFPREFIKTEWMNPEEGLIFGEIIETGETILILNALDSSLWEVDISEALTPPFLELELGVDVRVIGEKIGEGKFKAEFVRPGDPRKILQKMGRPRGERKMSPRAY